MNADLHLGKTMTDVRGNRIRIEEFILRPNDKEIDLLSLTLRDKDRLDYFRFQNLFANAIPENLTRQQWQSMWQDIWYLAEPENYLIEQRFKFSNINDWVFTGVNYKLENIGGAMPVFARGKDTEILAFGTGEIKGPSGASGAAPEMSVQAFLNPENQKFVREHRIYGSPVLNQSTNTFTQSVRKGWYDKTFNTNDSYKLAMTVYTNMSPEIISDNDFVVYTETNALADSSKSGDLAIKHRRFYNDGSWLSMDIYLINDYGRIMEIPNFSSGLWSGLVQLGNIIYNSNMEMAFNSDKFNSPDGIDVVSKLLWWVMLNPQNTANKTPSVYSDDVTIP
ncbi:MAG TPA: hypothetical protein P5511_06620, partial [Candidatus Goldiibacteriota bacterium]|nr:hypothetical protein [Candidatus Goldiibacteriota bacterium]